MPEIFRVHKEERNVERFKINCDLSSCPFPVYSYVDALEHGFDEDWPVVYFYDEIQALMFLQVIIRRSTEHARLQLEVLKAHNDKLRERILAMKINCWMYEELEKEICEEAEHRVYAYYSNPADLDWLDYERVNSSKSTEYCEDYGIIEECICNPDEDDFEVFIFFD